MVHHSQKYENHLNMMTLPPINQIKSILRAYFLETGGEEGGNKQEKK